MAAKKKATAKKGGGDTSSPVLATVGLPAGFVTTRTVTVPSMSIKKDQSACVRFDSPMRVSTVQDKPDATGKKREPATIANVTDVTTGEQKILIVSAVVKSNLENNYPDDTYVGKTFFLRNKGKRTEGQRYMDFEIHEGMMTAAA